MLTGIPISTCSHTRPRTCSVLAKGPCRHRCRQGHELANKARDAATGSVDGKSI
jgi:hypothetical protein